MRARPPTCAVSLHRCIRRLPRHEGLAPSPLAWSPARPDPLAWGCGGCAGGFKDWVGALGGGGAPANVQIRNTTPPDRAAKGAGATAFPVGGNLTIDAGAKLSMNLSTTSTQPLTIVGNVVNAGTLELSSSIGGDLNVHGQFTNSASSTPLHRAGGFVAPAARHIPGAPALAHASLANEAAAAVARHHWPRTAAHSTVDHTRQ